MADIENDEELVDYDEEEVRLTASSTTKRPLLSMDPIASQLGIYTQRAELAHVK
jgi:hypothetical protein